MWDFSDTFVTFDNPLYFFDGSGPGSGGASPTLPGGGTVVYGGRVTLPSKKLGEKIIIQFDFISKLAVGETLTTATCVASVYTGLDANPSAVIAATATVAGTVVNQLITGGVLGTIYDILAKATTSAGQIIELSAFLAVVPDLP